MAPLDTLVRNYLATISDEPDELRFLKSVPWTIDAGRQDQAHLLKGLRFEATWLPELPEQVVFSLLTPLWNTPPRLLRELILSVRCQSWLRWELILVDDGSTARDHIPLAEEWARRDARIKFFALDKNRGISGARNFAIEQSTGDFLVILDHDDLLHPCALGVFARYLNRDRDTNLIFSNEAKINEESDCISGFLTKPPFDLFTLLRYNYICHFTAIRRDLLLSARCDGQVFRPEYDGAEDHDLFLRIALTGRVRPIHVPLFLYYWRMTATSTSVSLSAKPEIAERRLALFDEMVPRAYPGARWAVVPPSAGMAHIHPSIKLRSIAGRESPSLLVVVPFKDNADLTLRCVESLEGQRHGLDVQVVLVDNRSTELTTGPALREWLAQPRRNRYEVMPHDGPFNFARLNNAAISRFGADRDLILFLNNDVELKSPDGLQTMAMQLLADERCGFVGIKLLYPDGQEVQHGGVKVTEHLIGSGYNVVDHARRACDFVSDEHIVFGVTFACAMTRREVYDRLGGLEEVMMPNGFGDVDLCARALEAGYRNYYFGTLVGVHHESRTRGRASEEAEFVALHERHSQTFAYWRLRNLSFTLHHTWPLIAVPPEALAAPPALAAVQHHVLPLPPPALPLRYKVADRLNHALKAVLGPVHHVVKKGVLFSWHSVKAVRPAPIGADREAEAGERRTFRRPFHLRKDRAHRG
jgi:GT2 family glycosyltransferase